MKPNFRNKGIIILCWHHPLLKIISIYKFCIATVTGSYYLVLIGSQKGAENVCIIFGNCGPSAKIISYGDILHMAIGFS